jgi:hypothetical protein
MSARRGRQRTQAKKSATSAVGGRTVPSCSARRVACFVGAVALNLASESPRKPDVAMSAAAADAAPVPQKRAQKRSVRNPRPRLDRREDEDRRAEDAPSAAARRSARAVQKVASVTITGCLEHDEGVLAQRRVGCDAPTAQLEIRVSEEAAVRIN